MFSKNNVFEYPRNLRDTATVRREREEEDTIAEFKKGGKVKKIKQKQKQKQSQQTKINIRIGELSKKKSKSRRRSERKEKADTKIQFVPQYIQSGPMITSDTVRGSLQPVNLSEALNKRLGEFEKKINEGIPLQNVDELKSLINQGIEAMKRPTDRRPPPLMRDDSLSSLDSGDMFYYNLPDDEEYSSRPQEQFYPLNFTEIKPVPRNEGPPRLEFEDDMKYPIDYIPDFFRRPLGGMGLEPNLPINLPPIEEEPEEEVNYPLVEASQPPIVEVPGPYKGKFLNKQPEDFPELIPTEDFYLINKWYRTAGKDKYYQLGARLYASGERKGKIRSYLIFDKEGNPESIKTHLPDKQEEVRQFVNDVFEKNQ
jgi:hypothetical protein